MAVKDHSLDDKIIRAAEKEFMDKGFSKASLHTIAREAGTTTGAIYTRYENKEALFCSLFADVLKIIGEKSAPVRELYEKALKECDSEAFVEAIKKEQQVYLDLMFSHYDECVLFFCKSAGSRTEEKIKALTDRKIRETAEYFKSVAGKDVDFTGIEFIMTQQNDCFRLILEKGYSRKQALISMKTVENFMSAGWKDFFERNL